MGNLKDENKTAIPSGKMCQPCYKLFEKSTHLIRRAHIHELAKFEESQKNIVFTICREYLSEKNLSHLSKERPRARQCATTALR